MLLNFLHKKQLWSLTEVVLMFLLALSGCGLETVTYLNPPQPNDNDPSIPKFSFRSTEKNNEIEFRGYDLYYKFFINIPSSSETNYTKEDELEQNGFFRVVSDTSDSRPLIEIPTGRRGDNFTVYVDFSPLVTTTTSPNNPEVYPDPSDVFDNLEIYRGVKDNDLGQYKSFLSIAVDDSDIGSEIYQSLENHSTLYILMYAISYGAIFSNFYTSDAVYLGYITIDNAYNLLE